jgi:hypothetical protein
MAVKKVSAKAKPKTVAKKPIAKKPVARKAAPKAKAEKPIPVSPATKVRKPRKAKVASSSYETMLKKQAELDAYKKQAKIELKKQYDEKLKEAHELKAHYHKLFAENIDSAPKGRSVATKKAGRNSRGYALDQVQSFLDQKDAGGKIKIEGKNATTVKRMQDAYNEAKSKDAESILAILNK